MNSLTDSKNAGIQFVAVIVAVSVLSLPAANSRAMENDPAKVSIDDDGTVHVPAFKLPLSVYMSEEAKHAYEQKLLHPISPEPSADIARQREHYNSYLLAPWLQKAKARYPVNIEARKFAGVQTDVITPKNGIAARNLEHVLINLHGGSFAFGAGMGGLIESIPIASVGKIKVISVDYREGPEYKFPAASEDVAAVYKELLKRYKPQNVGIYGCSAGGVLTGMAVAWFQKEHLPRPGAVGIFCAAADAILGGDSRYYTAPLEGEIPPPPSPNPPPFPMAYLAEVDLKNPMVSPVFTPAVITQFPPTLIITGTRSFELSSAVYTHTQLTKAGVAAELHVWDGMWHGFIYDVELPESREAFAAAANFFNLYLGRLAP